MCRHHHARWSPAEADLIRRAIADLTAVVPTVLVSDGGSDPQLVSDLGLTPGCTLVTPRYGSGLLGQVKTSLAAAYALEHPFILYTESDKAEFFEHTLAAFLEAAQIDHDVGIVVASRTVSSFRTFPAFQRSTETQINEMCAELFGVRCDYSYGPFLLNRRLVPYVLAVTEDLGWGWRPFVFGLAARAGLRLRYVEGDFECPEHQRVEDQQERLHRVRQLRQSRRGVRLSQSVPLP